MDRKFLTLIFVIFVLYSGMSQFGVQAIVGFNYFQENNTQQAVIPSNSLHYSIGPSYWFRLKNKRIEFNPAIVFDYNKSNYTQNNFGVSSINEYNVSFNIPILIYPLDFGNDCHCPTFNKSGHFFEKGFYFLIYPAIPYSFKKINETDSSFSKSFTSFQLGLGAGIDIGFNNKWTLSPAIMISKIFRDAYSFDTDSRNVFESGDSRYRLDFILRLLFFEKKRRY